MKIKYKFYFLLFQLMRFFPRVLNRINNEYWRGRLNSKTLQIGSHSNIIGFDNIKMGDNVFIGRFAWVEAIVSYNNQTFNPTIIIEDNVRFSENLHLSCAKLVKIGKNSLIGSRVHITDHNHGFLKGGKSSDPVYKRDLVVGETVIEENVFVGDGVFIRGGVRIGKNSVVGANSVVLKSMPENSVIAGVPAKVVRMQAY